MDKNIEISVTSLKSIIDCPLCFWLSNRVKPPRPIIARITVQLDSVIKTFMKKFIGRSDLPAWVPIQGTFFGASQTLKAVDLQSNIVVKGRLDALVKTANGKYYIIDYKTGRPPEVVPDSYQMQLDGYAFLLERNGYKPVAGGVLLYFTPKEGDLTERMFPFSVTPVHVSVNSSRVPPVLLEARRILEMEAPPPHASSCELCRWRREAGVTLSKFSAVKKDED